MLRATLTAHPPSIAVPEETPTIKCDTIVRALNTELTRLRGCGNTGTLKANQLVTQLRLAGFTTDSDTDSPTITTASHVGLYHLCTALLLIEENNFTDDAEHPSRQLARIIGSRRSGFSRHTKTRTATNLLEAVTKFTIHASKKTPDKPHSHKEMKTQWTNTLTSTTTTGTKHDLAHRLTT